MTQAVHIFLKDARRFWPQSLGVAGLFAIFAVLSPETTLRGASSLLEWGNLLSLLIVLACWTLTASVIHEDAPAQSSPFWLTRPYDRQSLLTAKVLFLLTFVFLPLVIAGMVLEVRSGVSVAGNAGTLIVLCIVRSCWLILPALTLSALTRNLTEFARIVFAFILVLAIAESGVTGRWMDIFSPMQIWYTTNAIAILPILLAAVGVLVFEYATRRTQWSRRMLMAGVIGSGLLMPREGVALFSVRAANPGFNPDRVRLTFDKTIPPQMKGMMKMRGFCFRVALRQDGLGAGMALRPLRAEAMLSSASWRDRIAQPAILEETEGGYSEIVCGGGPRDTLMTLRTSLYFAVLSVSNIATLPARRGVLDAGDAGRCEVVTPFPNSQLRCNLAEPISGSINAGLQFPGYSSFSKGFGDSSFLRLNPVVRQKFDGVTSEMPGGWPIDEALNRADAHFVLRSERVVGFVRRDLVYEDFVYPLMRLPPAPRPAGK